MKNYRKASIENYEFQKIREQFIIEITLKLQWNIKCNYSGI